MTRLSEEEIAAIDEEQKHVRSQWGDNRTLKNVRALLADREAIEAELAAAQKELATSKKVTREVLSSIRDVHRRIGVAASADWVREEIGKISNATKYGEFQ